MVLYKLLNILKERKKYDGPNGKRTKALNLEYWNIYGQKRGSSGIDEITKA